MRKSAVARLALLAYMAFMAVALSIIWAPAAYAGILQNRSDTVTDPSPSATTSHQFTFTTAGTAVIAYILFVFPTGFDVSSATLGLYSGIGAGTISADSATIARYTVTSPGSISSGTAITIQFQNVVNSSTTGTKTIAIQTKRSNNSTVDSGSVTVIIDNPASISATLQPVFVFTINTGTISLPVDPVSSPVATAGLTLTVATNTSAASGGYIVTARASQDLTGTAYSSAMIPAWTGTAASPTTWDSGSNPNYWGITRSAFPSDGGSYFGLTTAAQTVMSGTGPTNGDSQTQTWRVAVDYLTPADTYTTTVYIVGTPSF